MGKIGLLNCLKNLVSSFFLRVLIPVPVVKNDDWYRQASGGDISGTFVSEVNQTVDVHLGLRGYFLHQSKF